MGFRLRTGVSLRFYECFLELSFPTEGNASEVLVKYPESYQDENVLRQIPKFAFPCGSFHSTQTQLGVQSFSFVLTDCDGKFLFIFCRYASDCSTCLCFVSFLPFFEFFWKFLDVIAELNNAGQTSAFHQLMESLLRADTQPGSVLKLTFGGRELTVNVPDPEKLPAIPQNRNLTELYNCLPPESFMSLFSALLFERRLLLVSAKLTRLTCCVMATVSLLAPLQWQHVFVPLLPQHLIDYAGAPMPFVIGVHATMAEKAKAMAGGDAVIVDLDQGVVLSTHVDKLPNSVVAPPMKELQAASVGDGVSRAFMQALATIIGGYMQCLNSDGKFSHELFIETRPPKWRPLLERLLQLQLFEQFITDRVRNVPLSAEFERMCSLKTQDSAVTAAFQQVRERGRKAVKDARSKIQQRLEMPKLPGMALRREASPAFSSLPALPTQPDSPTVAFRKETIYAHASPQPSRLRAPDQPMAHHAQSDPWLESCPLAPQASHAGEVNPFALDQFVPPMDALLHHEPNNNISMASGSSTSASSSNEPWREFDPLFTGGADRRAPAHPPPGTRDPGDLIAWHLDTTELSKMIFTERPAFRP